MPSAYVDAIHGMAGYNDATAHLVKSALNSSILWRTHIGYRPFARHGFYVEGGYGLLAFGGGATSSEILTAVTGRAVVGADSGRHNYEASSTLHMVDAELGWEIPLSPALEVRAAAGGAFTAAASTTIRPAFKPILPNVVDPFTTYAENDLDHVYASHACTPVLGVSAAYVFF
jgi:hypothetical protein